MNRLVTPDLVQLQPRDEHNQRLAALTRPTDWINPAPHGRYNLVVIGAGTAGLVTAAGAAGLGAKVALIERELMGGDCLNVGCVPSKAVIRAGRAAAAVRAASKFGVHVPDGVHVDFAAVMERMRRLRAGIAPHDSVSRFTDLGVDVFLGQGSFVDSQTIAVGDQRLNFRRAVIATGAAAAAPPIDGLPSVDYLTNESVFSLTELPRRLGIIGAGPIGCELAQAFARFGAEVFLVESADHVLPREDPDAALIVQQALVHDGVRLLCRGKNLRLAPAEDGVLLTGETSSDLYEHQVDKLLVAVGRSPNVKHLNLEAVGVDYDRQGVKVNDRLQTTNPSIYAAGDICSPYKFTHAADFQARIVIQNALFKGRAKASALLIPWCTYTSPEIAHVGLYETEAVRKGVAIDTYRQAFSDVDRAILDGEEVGLVKVHVKQGTDKILGATVVAQHAGDMISELTLAMRHGLGLKQIGSTIHPYPTQAEAIRKLGDQYSRTRLTPFVKKLFHKWLSWTR